MRPPPVFEDVVAAERRVAPVAVRTPVLRNPALDKAAGAEILVKPECLQVTGSFKIRGAMNRLSKLSDGRATKGVVAFSSGNHAQGVARAARHFGLSALIVMPSDAPGVKVDGVRADGAEILFYKRESENREEMAARIAAERDWIVVPSYDDPDIIAGQGTVGLELVSQAEDDGAPLDHVICCAGGGGLIAGAALVFSQLSPETKLWSAEPVGFDDHRTSLAAGRRVGIEPGATSICDAILTPTPGEITFAINSTRLAGGVAVTDDEVRAAMRFAFKHLKIVVEPGGAVALASVLRGAPDEMREQRIGVIVSGGNVDPSVYAEILAAPI